VPARRSAHPQTYLHSALISTAD
jgi:hypothetical protein